MAMFDDEILSVYLNFKNPGKRDMQDADKLAAHMSYEFDSLLRKAIAANKPIAELGDSIKRVAQQFADVHQMATTLGMTVASAKSFRGILGRYTPYRLERIQESVGARAVETSGSAAMRKGLSENTEAMRRLTSEISGRFERHTRGSDIGRGLFIDTETTGLNPLRHQVVELAAIQFTFKKSTGEILNAMESVYHGFQEFDKRLHLALNPGRSYYFPTGLKPSEIAGKSIDIAALNKLIKGADFVITHNLKHDVPFISKITQEINAVPKMDSLYGIPWRQLGQRSRHLQDLLRVHGIDPGQSHRAVSDVQANIRLLGSRPPTGGPTYMGMLWGSHGEQTMALQMMGYFRSVADELRKNLHERTGLGSRYDPTSVRYQLAQPHREAPLLEPAAEIPLYAIASINTRKAITARSRRPAHSTEFGIRKGAGITTESTPGQRTDEATLERQIATINEFLRNAALMSGPGAAAAFVGIHQKQLDYQEQIQRGIGRERRSKYDIRGADQLALAAMGGTNAYLRNEVSGAHLIPRNQFGEAMQRTTANRQTLVRQMLQQPWAIPEREFTGSEIERFIAEHGQAPGTSSILTAAQMLAQITPPVKHRNPRNLNPYSRPPYVETPPIDPRTNQLATIMLKGQEEGRRLAAEAATEEERKRYERVQSTMAGRTFKKVRGGARPRTGETGSFDPLGLFTGLFEALRGKREPTLSAEERAARGEYPEPNGPRASIRRDAFEERLRKLAAAAESAQAALEGYRKTILEVKVAEASRQREARRESIGTSEALSNISSESQLNRIRSRRQASRTTGLRQLRAGQGAYEEKLSALSRAELEAESSYEVARSRLTPLAAKLEKNEAFFGAGGAAKKEKALAELEARMTRPAQLRLMRAQLARQVAELSNPEEIQQVRAEYVARASALRFSNIKGVTTTYMGKEVNVEDLRAQYEQRLMESVGGRTEAQKVQEKRRQVLEDQVRQRQRFSEDEEKVQRRQSVILQKFQTQRLQVESKFYGLASKLNDQFAKKKEQTDKKLLDLEAKAHAAKVKYIKTEDAMRGKGGGGGEGGGGGGGFLSGSSRSGYGIGFGLPAVLALDAGLKELIKDSAIYAAKVQLMEFSTAQMAKTSGLNVQAVQAEVEALKKRNITTEEANSVVQKLMLTQQDLSKAGPLVEVAQNLAAMTGADAMQTIDRLMSGIVTGYTRNLHQMGLQVTMTSAMRELKAQRKAQGITAEPTEYERREALVNQVLQEGAKISGTYEQSMTTAGGQFAYLRKEVLDTSNVLGKEFLPQFTHLMSLMSGGLQFVQQHAEAFAGLAKVIASLSAGLTAVGSTSFITWMMGSAPVPLPYKIGIGAAAGVAALAATGFGVPKDRLLEQNKDRAQEMARAHIAVLQEDANKVRARMLVAPKEDQEGLKNRLRFDQDSIASEERAILDMEKQFNDQLADLYNERRKTFEQGSADHVNAAQRAAEYIEEKYYNVGSAATSGFVHGTIKLGQFIARDPLIAGTKALLAGKMKPSPPAVPGPAANRSEVQRLADQKLKDELNGPPDSLVDTHGRRVAVLNSMLEDMQTQIEQNDKKLLGFGEEELQKKFERGMQTPEEQLEFTYQKAIFPFKKATREKLAQQYEAEAAQEPDANKAKDLRDKAAQARNAEKDAADIIAEAQKDRGAAAARMARNREGNIRSIVAQTQVEGIRGLAIPGNYESQRQAIQKIYEINQKLVNSNKELVGPNQTLVDLKSVEAERERSLAQLETQRLAGARKRQEVEVLDESMQRQRAILAAPGLSSEEAINKALAEELSSIDKLSDDEDKLNRAQQARIVSREKLRDLAAEEAEAALNRGVESYNRAAGLQANIARITRGLAPGSGEDRAELADIEAQRRLQVQQAQEELRRRLEFLKTPEGQASIGDKPMASVVKEARANEQQQEEAANVDAANARLEARNRQLAAARERTVESYDQAFQVQERIARARAKSESEEAASAEQLHNTRLAYIQAEYEARGKTIEAERTKNQETIELEAETLEQMLEAQKKKYDDIKSSAAQFFEVLTTDHGSGLKSYLQGQVRGMGAKMFGNIMAELFQNVNLSLPGITDKNGNVTKLGRIMAGVGPFGSIVPTAADIKKQEDALRDAQQKKAMYDAETDNTKALQDLTRELEELTGKASPAAPGVLGGIVVNGKVVIPGLGQVAKPTEPTSPAMGVGPWNNVPLFGSGGNNPLIFHMSGGTNYPTLAPAADIPSIAAGVGQTVQLSIAKGIGYAVSSPTGLSTMINTMNRTSAALGGTGGMNFAGGGSTLIPGFPGAGIGLAQVSSDIPELAEGVGQAVQSTIAKGIKYAVLKPSGMGIDESVLDNALGKGGGGGNNSFVLYGVGGGSGLPLPSGSGSKLGFKSPGNDVAAALMIGAGGYQAIHSFGGGRGTRGTIMGIGGGLQAAAGIASLIPGGQAVALGLEAASLITDLVGGFFEDPRQKRATQIANYLAMTQYMAPPKLSYTTALSGGFAAEGKGGTATASGIPISAAQVIQPYLEQLSQPNILGLFTSPLAYLQGKPGLSTVPTNPNLAYPFGIGNISASALSGSQQYQFSQVPGQVLYNNLPADVSQPNHTINVNISAVDAKSILDRSGDIAAAVQKELLMGNQLSMSLQSAVFGVK